MLGGLPTAMRLISEQSIARPKGSQTINWHDDWFIEQETTHILHEIMHIFMEINTDSGQRSKLFE
jgi:hypothetical protein